MTAPSLATNDRRTSSTSLRNSSNWISSILSASSHPFTSIKSQAWSEGKRTVPSVAARFGQPYSPTGGGPSRCLPEYKSGLPPSRPTLTSAGAKPRRDKPRDHTTGRCTWLNTIAQKFKVGSDFLGCWRNLNEIFSLCCF